MENKQLSTVYLGSGFLVIALLMWKFLPSTDWINFFEGVFVGLSIALNLRYAFNRSRKT